MDFLRAAASAASAALSSSNSVPSLPAYALGDRDVDYEGLSLWQLYEGTKKDDQTPVSVFSFDTTSSPSRRSLLPLAKNALRKLKTLRHPDVLKYLDGVENEASVWIVTERVVPLTKRLGPEGQLKDGGSEEWKVWGLSRITNALAFINSSGASTHGNIRLASIFLSPAGEWRIGGFEVLSSSKDGSPVLYTMGGLLPNASRFASPEVRASGYGALKTLDPHALDSYQLHLLLFTLFNGPLPASFSSDSAPSLPPNRGAIPTPIFQACRRLGAANVQNRMKIEAFHQQGMTEGGFYASNRLVRLAAGLENFALASEGERAVLIKMVKDSSQALPSDFMAYKVLPALVKAFEFGPGGPALLPLLLSMGSALPPADYTNHLLQPLVRMFASSDRAMRLALLEGLPSYADKLENRVVVEKVWPHLLTGFTDVVPVIREATVKSILIIAPKLTDRILNNDLLRHLAKAQTDPEPGIRTNTCILLGRLSKHLSPATNRKVLVPAFARALRDTFVHARIAGLMALMATVECYEREDLAGKVIPSMAICLVDKEKTVRDQAFKAIDMFVKRVEAQVADMPASVLPPPSTQENGEVAAATNAPGLATNAAGAAGALAGWAFTSLSKRLAAGELEAAPARPASAPLPVTLVPTNTTSTSTAPRSTKPSTLSSPPLANIAALASTASLNDSDPGDWGGDLIDVNADADDWDAFESAAPAAPAVDPLAARLSTTSTTRKPPSSTTKLSTKPIARPTPRAVASTSSLGSSSLKLAAAKKPSLALQLEAEAGGADAWDLDDDTTGDAWDTNGTDGAAGDDDWGEFDTKQKAATTSPKKPAANGLGAKTRLAEERRAKVAAAAARGRGLGVARKLGP